MASEISKPRGRPRKAGARIQRVNVRCTDAEHAAIEAAAAEVGMEVSDFLRDRMLRGKPPRPIRVPQVDRQRLAEVLTELQAVGPWLNEMARRVNAGEMPPTSADLAELQVRTEHMQDLLNQALSRRAS